MNLSRKTPRAFSLMELLVAVALLALVGLLIGQVTGAISRAARLSNQGVDAAAQARQVFDRMGLDLENAVLRADADFSVPAGSSDVLLTFLSAVPSAGTNANRKISALSYRMGTNAETGGRRTLLRAGRALAWNEAGFLGLHVSGSSRNLPIAFSDPVFPAQPAAGDHDVVAPAVVQAVVGFQLCADNRPVLLADGTSFDHARGQIVYSPPVRGATAPASSYVDAGRIASLVMGLAVIDPERLKQADAAAFSALAAAFTVAPAHGELPVARWMADTGNLANLPAGVPLPVRQSVRLYQRFFPLDPP